MIFDGYGSILDAETQAVVNPINCVGVMGSGLALQFKNKHPALFESYKKRCDNGEINIGKMYVYSFPCSSKDCYKHIINFPTKKHWKYPSKLKYIEEGLIDLVDVVKRLNVDSIAVPKLGCGKGGLQWNCVKPLIIDAFLPFPNLLVKLY